MRLISMLASLILIAGCAARIQDLTKTQYMAPAFTASHLKEGGIALLPITAGRGQEGYRRPLGTILNEHLPRAFPATKTLGWESTMRLLNSNDLVTDYQAAIEAYQQTSILDRQVVTQFEDVLGVRYALYCSLQDFSEKSETNYNFITGLETKKTASVIAHCLVLDLNTGDVVQEIVGHATSAAGKYQYNSPYDTYAATIAEAVVAELPGAKVEKAKDEPATRSAFDDW